MKVNATYDISTGGRKRRVSVTRLEDAGPRGATYEIRVDDGAPVRVNATRPVPDVLALLVDDASWEAGLVPTDDGFEVEVLGVRHAVAVADPRRAALRMAGGASDSVLRCPMPGRVVRVLVGVGDRVSRGQPLLVVEAMKMENELKSPTDGLVRRIAVKDGDLVDARALLVELGGEAAG